MVNLVAIGMFFTNDKAINQEGEFCNLTVIVIVKYISEEKNPGFISVRN